MTRREKFHPPHSNIVSNTGRVPCEVTARPHLPTSSDSVSDFLSYNDPNLSPNKEQRRSSKMRVLLSSLLLSLLFASCFAAPRPNVNNCTKMMFEQHWDQFGWRAETFLQRVYFYDKWLVRGGPMFFYTGNEGNVALYTNCTGLMWENAQSMGALLVFAEHRFYGESKVCKGGLKECGDYLGSEQAMADFAALIVFLKTKYPQIGATIVFGGSYGGMLAAWMRMRYPNLVDGAIASSAPLEMLASNFNTSSYWAVVTRAATRAGGSSPLCAFKHPQFAKAGFRAG